jgi:hypothetical protein
MNKFIDDSLVALALAASVGYALSSLGPRGLRTALRRWLANAAAQAPAVLHLGGVARRLAAAADAKAGCGGCGGCGDEAAGGGTDAVARGDTLAGVRGGTSGGARGGDRGQAAAEISVPLSSIGKRGQS